MSWVRVDDGMPEHPKVFRAATVLGGPHCYARVISILIQASSFASRNLTDGFLPTAVVQHFHDARPLQAAKAMVEANLWEAVVGGYQIHDYHEYNPTAADVKADREWDRRRKELYANPALVNSIKQRDQHCCRYCGVPVTWTDRRGPMGGQFDHVEPRGANTPENIVVACRKCNNKKNNRTPEEAGMPLLPVPDLNGTSSRPYGDGNGEGNLEPGESEGVSPVPALMAHYHDGFLRRFGEKPHIQGRKDGQILKQLATTHGSEAVKRRIDALLDTTDEFVAGAGRTIGLLSTCWNKLGRPLKPTAIGTRSGACRHTPPCADDAACTKRKIDDMKKGAA